MIDPIDAIERRLANRMHDACGHCEVCDLYTLLYEVKRLRLELATYTDEARRAESGEWKCERCEKWQPMQTVNVGIDCDMCEPCAEECRALEGTPDDTLHGYSVEDCRERFFAGEEVFGDEIREWMREAEQDEDEATSTARFYFLQGHAAEWLKQRRGEHAGA